MYNDLNFCDKRTRFLIGCDEVGRGPLAGPVVSASVMVEEFSLENLFLLREIGVTDSKKLTPKKRQAILQLLDISISALHLREVYERTFQGIKISFILNSFSHAEIDKLNILRASLLSMEQGCLQLGNREQRGSILIDGNKPFYGELPSLWNQFPIVKGDQKSILIGLSAIIAKEYRDFVMKEWDKKFPAYQFAKNAGYPTKHHREMLQKVGPCSIHRRTFKGVKEFLHVK